MRLFLDEQTQGVVVIGKARVGGERLQRLGRQGSQLGGYKCRLRRQLHLQLGHPGLERHEFGFAGILIAAHEGVHVQPNDIQHDGVELFHAFQHGGCVGQLALIRSKAGLFRDSRLNLAVQCLPILLRCENILCPPFPVGGNLFSFKCHRNSPLQNFSAILYHRKRLLATGFAKSL